MAAIEIVITIITGIFVTDNINMVTKFRIIVSAIITQLYGGSFDPKPPNLQNKI